MTTSEQVPPGNLRERMDREHTALRRKIQGIHSVLSAHNPDAKQVEGLLREFMEALRVHFTTEEMESFFAEVVARTPQHAERASELCVEHCELLREADDLCRFAEAGSPSMPWWRELNGRCHEFCKRLARHEAEEHRLLDEAHHAGMGPAA